MSLMKSYPNSEDPFIMPTKITRRRLMHSAAAGVTTALLRTPAIARTSLTGSGTVVIFDGGGSLGSAQREAYSKPFELETGIKVIHQPAITDGVQRAAIVAGAPKCDVALLSGGSLADFEREQLFQPIDYGYWDQSDRDGFDVVPASKDYVPAMLYSLLIAYDADAFPDRRPEAWADLWNAATFPGKRTLASGANAADGGTYEIALLADGVAPEKLYPLDWDRALRSLDRIRSNVVKWWATGAESIQLQVDKQATVGSAWNGRIDVANEQGAKIEKNWNQGLLQWAAWAVPKGATNADNAQKYIAFMSRPENQAKFSDLITYGPTNSRAFKYLSPERTLLMPTSPELKGKQVVQNYAFWNTIDGTGEAGLRRAVAEWERWIAH